MYLLLRNKKCQMETSQQHLIQILKIQGIRTSVRNGKELIQILYSEQIQIADRIGVVVKDSTGQYKVLTGNQTGVLLTHYILCIKRRK